MKQGLSLRVSQHLALTPQLQQSIRLLQLSTLELSQEIEQMLEANPFLEIDHEAAEREQYGLEAADALVSQGDRLSELPASATLDYASATTSTSSNADDEATPLSAEPGGDGDNDTADAETHTEVAELAERLRASNLSSEEVYSSASAGHIAGASSSAPAASGSGAGGTGAGGQKT